MNQCKTCSAIHVGRKYVGDRGTASQKRYFCKSQINSLSQFVPEGELRIVVQRTVALMQQ